jgi:hypothetical protein
LTKETQRQHCWPKCWVSPCSTQPTSLESFDGYGGWHPSVKWLLDEFGNEEDVLLGLEKNIELASWSGGLETYYQLYIAPIDTLRSHKLDKVHEWAIKKRKDFYEKMDLERERHSEIEFFEIV